MILIYFFSHKNHVFGSGWFVLDFLTRPKVFSSVLKSIEIEIIEIFRDVFRCVLASQKEVSVRPSVASSIHNSYFSNAKTASF